MVNIRIEQEEGVWYVIGYYMESGAESKWACPSEASALLKSIKLGYKA